MKGSEPLDLEMIIEKIGKTLKENNFRYKKATKIFKISKSLGLQGLKLIKCNGLERFKELITINQRFLIHWKLF